MNKMNEIKDTVSALWSQIGADTETPIQMLAQASGYSERKIKEIQRSFGNSLSPAQIKRIIENLPPGHITTYGAISQHIRGNLGGSRAVGRIIRTAEFSAREAAVVISTSSLKNGFYVLSNQSPQFISHHGVKNRAEALQLAGIEHSVRGDNVYVRADLVKWSGDLSS